MDTIRLDPELGPNDMPLSVWDEIHDEYLVIEAFYGEQKAERSGVPLIHHIREGVKIMWRVGADFEAMRAYCVHPLFQGDENLQKFLYEYEFDSRVMIFAMEYRQWANRWLSDKVWTQMLPGGRRRILHTSWPDCGPLVQVRHMLIADKVQNFKDFLAFHKDSHPRSAELDHYFRTWLGYLGVYEAFDILKHVDAT